MSTSTSSFLTQQNLWRLVGFGSSIVAFSCYALGPSFRYLFGEWNLLKIVIYIVLTSIFSCWMLFAERLGLTKSVLLRAHVCFFVLMATSVYSFYQDRSEQGREENVHGKMLSLISCGAFALMSMSLSRQTAIGFELGMSSFFLGSVMLAAMKLNAKFAIGAAVFCYILINIRSYSDSQLERQGNTEHVIDMSSVNNEHNVHDHQEPGTTTQATYTRLPSREHEELDTTTQAIYMRSPPIMGQEERGSTSDQAIHMRSTSIMEEEEEPGSTSDQAIYMRSTSIMEQEETGSTSDQAIYTRSTSIMEQEEPGSTTRATSLRRRSVVRHNSFNGFDETHERELARSSRRKFSEACYLCKRTLVLGRDVYMFSGWAFCSPECRLRQIENQLDQEKQQILEPKKKKEISAALTCRTQAKGDGNFQTRHGY